MRRPTWLATASIRFALPLSHFCASAREFVEHIEAEGPKRNICLVAQIDRCALGIEDAHCAECARRGYLRAPCGCLVTIPNLETDRRLALQRRSVGQDVAQNVLSKARAARPFQYTSVA